MWLFSLRLLLAGGFVPFAWLVAAAQCLQAQSGMGYEEMMRHADEQHSLGHFPEARAFFSRAHALNPNARTLRGMGLSCYESRNYVKAIDYLRQALDSTEQPLTATMRTEIEQRVRQAEQLVTYVEITVEPTSARLELDHVEQSFGHVEQSPDHIAQSLEGDGVVLLLDPGVHELSASAEGYATERRIIGAEGGRMHVDLRLRKALAAQSEIAAQPLAAPPARAAKHAADETGGSTASSIVIASGVAALVAGGVLVGMAASDKYAVEHAAPGTPWSELEPRYDRGLTFFPVGFALMGVGFAGAVVGLTWKLWPDQERDPRAQLRVSPTDVALSGQF